MATPHVIQMFSFALRYPLVILLLFSSIALTLIDYLLSNLVPANFLLLLLLRTLSFFAPPDGSVGRGSVREDLHQRCQVRY